MPSCFELYDLVMLFEGTTNNMMCYYHENLLYIAESNKKM